MIGTDFMIGDDFTIGTASPGGHIFI